MFSRRSCTRELKEAVQSGAELLSRLKLTYTRHPALNCEACGKKDIRCVQSFWDGPDPGTMQYPNPVTKSLVAHGCLGCRGGRSECSNKGVHILNPALPKVGSRHNLTQ
jgi:hypothetical protein